MRILSLFAGIGGLERGLEAAGVGHTVAQCEIEPFPISVLERHWPNARRFTDVRKLTADRGAADVICGGFPCQDISNAGNKAGIAVGTRSGLRFEYARLVREVMPSFVAIENVAALLSKGMGIVLSDLYDAGFDATWDCIPAAAVGAPHRRDRVFIIAWRRDKLVPAIDLSSLWANARELVLSRGDSRWPAGQWPTPSASMPNDGENPETWLARADALKAKGINGNGAGMPLAIAAKLGTMWPSRPLEPQHKWEPPRTTTVRTNRAPRLKALGNAVVPQAAEVAGHVLLSLADGLDVTPVEAHASLVDGAWVSSKSGSAVTKFPRAGSMRYGSVYVATPCAPISSLSKGLWPTAMSRDHKDTGDMGNVNTRAGRPPDTLPRVVFAGGDAGRLNPDWVEALMGLPVGWTSAATADKSEQEAA